MGAYYCHECDHYRDSRDGCYEHPSQDNELVCEECFAEMPEPTIEVRQGGVFSKAQLAQIAKMEQESILEELENQRGHR